jgi:soluble lytic murein transglycosylase-like protein
MIFALLLASLEALLSSNAIGFFGVAMHQPVNIVAHQASMMPSVSLPDPGIQCIDALLKKFAVNEARRKRVAEAIVRSSRRHNLDPRLVASIIIVESRGNPFAISPSDAVGVMQVHVPTWARIVDEEGINLFKIEDNIDFGVRILRDYVGRYGHDDGIKRYNGWNPDSPESTKSAEAYLQKVQHIYLFPVERKERG